jgi:hypothetical protein
MSIAVLMRRVGYAHHVGQHPQGVRRGCKGLKPQQHTQSPTYNCFTFEMEMELFTASGEARYIPNETRLYSMRLGNL